MTAIELIAMEREKQVRAGYDAQHDDEHHPGELTSAGIAQASIALGMLSEALRTPKEIADEVALVKKEIWPFEPEAFKVQAPLDMLIEAGALIAAEIDKRLRLVRPPEEEVDGPRIILPGGRN